MTNDVFENKIKPILTYIGVIGASLTSIGYIIIVFVLIRGFEYHQTTQALIFAIVNAIIGLIIMMFLKVQGTAFAKELPENKKILDAYNNKKIKGKKNHSLNYFWITSTITDILSKGLGIVITTTGLIYIVIEGSNDYRLLGLAAVNLILFICFGLLSLVKAYDFYNDEYIPFMKDKIKEADNDSSSNNRHTCKTGSVCSDIPDLANTSGPACEPSEKGE